MPKNKAPWATVNVILKGFAAQLRQRWPDLRIVAHPGSETSGNLYMRCDRPQQRGPHGELRFWAQLKDGRLDGHMNVRCCTVQVVSYRRFSHDIADPLLFDRLTDFINEGKLCWDQEPRRLKQRPAP